MYLKVKVKKKKHQKTIASDNFFLKVFYEWFFETWPDILVIFDLWQNSGPVHHDPWPNAILDL